MPTRTRLRIAARRIRERIETGLWFAPLIMSICAVAPACAMYWSAEVPDTIKSGHGDTNDGASEACLSDQPIVTETEGYPVRVKGSGYIQTIDPDAILGLAQHKDLVICLLHKPGHFVRSGATVALVSPANHVNDKLAEQLCRAFELGNVRTPTQDLEYAVNQLTEMAVRAMSAAINDPFTAMTCLDHIGNGLTTFIRQGERGSHFYDGNGRLRLILEPATFDELLSASFDMLRHSSSANATVLLHMLEVLDRIRKEATTAEVRRSLAHHANLIDAESQSGDLIEQDRAQIRLRRDDLLSRLNATPS